MKRHVVCEIALEVPEHCTKSQLETAVRAALDVGREGWDEHETLPVTVTAVDVRVTGRW